jgi:RHS repeat-associated protein
MLASSFFDAVLGLDVHFEMVPMPAPVPMPIPNPFVGYVYDPMGLIAGLVIGAAFALKAGAPVQGPVLYWTAFPATNTGTEAKALVNHIMFPPGTSWTPFPKTPKPVIHKGETPAPALPITPENDAVIVFGSKTVTVMGSNAVRTGDIALSCSEPLRLPSSVVLAVPKGAPILIGGPPSLDIMAALFASLRTRFVSDSLHALASRLAPGRWRDFWDRLICTFTGHPVDVASGKVMTEFVDVELPGPLPLKIERIYSSAFASRPGPVGHGWSFSLNQAIWRERGKVVLLAEDGREIEFDTFDFPHHRIEAGQQIYNPIERLTLHCKAGERWLVVDHLGQSREYAAVPGRRDGRAMLQRIRSGCGYHEIRFAYDDRGWLEWVIDSCGRTIRLHTDEQGRVLELHLPQASGDGHDCHRRYVYDDEGDLVEVSDVLAQRWRFAYVTHLLTQETDRNGLSFYFAYDGLGAAAWCVRTWGDGGIYDHVLNYDKRKQVTYVTNSRGHTTAYHMNVLGLVIKIVDPLGGETCFECDPRTLARTGVTDELGRKTRYSYDERGNLIEQAWPDESTARFTYDDNNQLTQAIDQNGGRWQWWRDERGRLLERSSPDGASTRLTWCGSLLESVVDATGGVTSLEHDTAGNLVRARLPNDATLQWSYDRLGQPLGFQGPTGAVQQLRRDLDGRIIEVHEADGMRRNFTLDGEGRALRIQEPHRELEFVWAGLDQLLVHREAGVETRFEYDTEEQVVGLTNAHGDRYVFERDTRGEVIAEVGWAGDRRRLERDAAGQICRMTLPSGMKIASEWTTVGKLERVAYGDGGFEHYHYRADGLLTQVRNETCTIEFERDPLGRITSERQGEHRVESRFDRGGTRLGLRSSFGVELDVQVDATGRWSTLTVGEGGVHRWTAETGRDVAGDEVDRRLPGEVRDRWARDALGRPTQHQVWDGAVIRDLHYGWNVDARLWQLLDAVTGERTEYCHDALGRLASARKGDAVELRIPDALGNLYRSADRTDRLYGADGRLLQAEGREGEVQYEYDEDGRRARRLDSDGRVWSYRWNAAGRLVAVERPDGEVVECGYDALGRRVWKRFAGRTTRWIWDGDVILHEWTEDEWASEAALPDSDVHLSVEDSVLEAHRAGGPADGEPLVELRQAPLELVTWVSDPETLAPAAKLVGEWAYSVVCDHLGTPVLMLDEIGRRVWAAEISTWGELRIVLGDAADCPHRFAGQYEDQETGLVYNRYRYFDPAAGQYLCVDPIRLAGGLNSFAYVGDPLVEFDPLGLAKCARNAQQELRQLGRLEGRSASAIAKLLTKRGFRSTLGRNGGTVWTKKMPKGQTAVVRLDPPTPPTPRAWADEVAHAHKEIVPTAAVNRRGNFDGDRATTLDDAARRTLEPRATHIPISD